MNNRPLIFLTSLLFFAQAHGAFAQQTPSITIKAHQSIQNGSTHYQYRIFNNTTSQSVVGFIIGHDYYHDVSELQVAPTGWGFQTRLPEASSTSPMGWRAVVITTEESPDLQLEWRPAGPLVNIRPGETLSGFSIITPQPDDHYLTGHWTVFLSDATAVSATLVVDENPFPIDRTPTIQSRVTELFIATMGRAPDPMAHSHWSQQIAQGLTTLQITQRFLEQPEAKAKYPEGTPSTAFITAIYKNAFNRPPDTTALRYWSGALERKGLSRAQMIADIVQKAKSAGENRDDATVLSHKEKVGEYFAVSALAAQSDRSKMILIAQRVIALIDNTWASVTRSIDYIDEQSEQIVP